MLKAIGLFILVFLSCSTPGCMGFFGNGDGQPVLDPSEDWKEHFKIETGLLTDVIWPQDEFLLVNDTLELFCKLTALEGHSSDLYFDYKPNGFPRHLPVPEEYQTIVNDSTIRMVWPGMQETAYFFCKKNESSGTSKMVAATEVVVLTRPKPIENLSCISYNNYNMTCNWCDDVEEGVQYNLEWRVSSVRNGTCPIPGYHEVYKVLCSCTFCMSQFEGGDCDEQPQTFFPPNPYDMNITSEKPKVPSESNVVTVDTSAVAIVKPHPPRSLQASDVGIRSAVLTWKPPADLYQLLQYELSYSTPWENLVELEPTTDKSAVLDDLHPYTQHTINLSARPYPNGTYASDPAVLEFKTLEDVPAIPPEMTQGMFRITQDDTYRKIYIYWQHIHEYDMNGEFASYTIRSHSALGLTSLYTITRVDTYCWEVGALREDQAYNVSVAASTGAGEGPMSSLIFPRANDVLPQPFHIDGVINGSAVLFTILPPDGVNVTQYTLLWCTGISTRHDCQGPPETLILDPAMEEFVVDGYVPGYVYSVAVNSAESASGLGEHWLCLYDWDGDPGFVEFTFPEEQQERSLTLRWDQLECGNSVRGKAILYIIQWNVTFNDSTSMQVDRVKVPVEYGQIEYTYTITGLLPYTDYTVTMQACSEVRCGFVPERTHRTPPSAPEDEPSSVEVTALDSAKISVTWSPPEVPNGIITAYTIFVNSSEESFEEIVPGTSYQATVTGLYGYDEYSVHVIAENEAGESPSSKTGYIWTPMRAPSPVDFQVTIFINESIHMTWSPPHPPHGPISYYVVQMVQRKDDKPVTWNQTVYSTALLIMANCSSGSKPLNVTVIAVNVDEDSTRYPSQPGEVESVEACSNSPGTPSFAIPVGVTVGILVVVFIVLAVYFVRRCCRDYTKKIEIANIDPEVKLPILDRFHDEEQSNPYAHKLNGVGMLEGVQIAQQTQGNISDPPYARIMDPDAPDEGVQQDHCSHDVAAAVTVDGEEILEHGSQTDDSGIISAASSQEASVSPNQEGSVSSEQGNSISSESGSEQVSTSAGSVSSGQETRSRAGSTESQESQRSDIPPYARATENQPRFAMIAESETEMSSGDFSANSSGNSSDNSTGNSSGYATGYSPGNSHEEIEMDDLQQKADSDSCDSAVSSNVDSNEGQVLSAFVMPVTMVSSFEDICGDREASSHNNHGKTAGTTCSLSLGDPALLFVPNHCSVDFGDADDNYSAYGDSASSCRTSQTTGGASSFDPGYKDGTVEETRDIAVEPVGEAAAICYDPYNSNEATC